jgi:hypothetical protein
VTFHFWDVSQSFDKPTAFTLKVRGSFLILEDKGTTFIRNVGNQRSSFTSQKTGILDKNQNKVKFPLSFNYTSFPEDDCKIVSSLLLHEFVALALIVLHIRRLVTGFSQLSFR